MLTWRGSAATLGTVEDMERLKKLPYEEAIQEMTVNTRPLSPAEIFTVSVQHPEFRKSMLRSYVLYFLTTFLGCLTLGIWEHKSALSPPETMEEES